MARVAVIGEGVIGTSSALAIKRIRPNVKITVFHDRPFEKTCSAMPAGLFRFDNVNDREDAKATFKWYAELCRHHPGTVTGVKLLSGHIQSDSREALEGQERAYGDIVYNFRFLSDRERKRLFPEPSRHAIHFSSYAAEGNRYVPFLKEQLLVRGVQFVQRAIKSFDEVADEGFDVVVNCAGLNAGILAGDDDGVYPIRGVVFEVDAPWHKHFNYRDFSTFTIPKNNCVVVGSVKQANRSDIEVTEEDRRDIWQRYEKLQPAMKRRELGEHRRIQLPPMPMADTAETPERTITIPQSVVRNYKKMLFHINFSSETCLPSKTTDFSNGDCSLLSSSSRSSSGVQSTSTSSLKCTYETDGDTNRKVLLSLYYLYPEPPLLTVGEVKSGVKVKVVGRQHVQGAKITGEWCHLRPARDSIRVESQQRQTRSGKKYTLVHHYGHGGHGFTVGWGTALRAAVLVDQAFADKAKL